jgi:hypothetical protein
MAGEATNERTTDGYAGPDAGGGQLETSVARGRGAGTPVALLGSVASLVWGALAVLAAVVLLIWWLA